MRNNPVTMRATLFLTLSLLPLASFAVVDTTSKTDPGASDTTWSWVGSIGGCSAVAVGPNTVLTAAHVGASDFWMNGKAYSMASTVQAPTIDGSAVDLRVVQLRDTLPGWYGIGTAVKKNDAVTMVGFGVGGVVNAISSGYAVGTGGGRRAGNNTISDLKTVSGYGPTLRSMLGGAGDSALTGGDSGGGWFVKGKLVGISSFVFLTQNKPEYGWAKSPYFGSSAIDLTNSKVSKWVAAQIASVATRKAVSRSLGDVLVAADMGEKESRAAVDPSNLLAVGIGLAAFFRRHRR